MRNTIKIIASASGDWYQAFLNGNKFYEGHCGTNMMFVDLCALLKIHMEYEEISDKEMEERCYQ